MKKLQSLFFRRSVLGALLLGMSTLLSLPAYSQVELITGDGSRDHFSSE